MFIYGNQVHTESPTTMLSKAGLRSSLTGNAFLKGNETLLHPPIVIDTHNLYMYACARCVVTEDQKGTGVCCLW